jgi:hypothetical protein
VYVIVIEDNGVQILLNNSSNSFSGSLNDLNTMDVCAGFFGGK